MASKIFSCPVIIEYHGWVHIRANSIQEAKKKAELLDDEGVELHELEDVSAHSEVAIEELMEEDIIDYQWEAK
jgi:hypothetical protein